MRNKISSLKREEIIEICESELTYQAIDQMIEKDGKPRPDYFGGGLWNAEEEFEFYKKQVGDRYSKLQWKIIESYFKTRRKEK